MTAKNAILILHFKDSEHTLPCLDSLLKLSAPSSIYILSVQSPHSEAIKSHPAKPTVIDTDNNGGFAWANNLLIKRALKDDCRAVILLNNDTTVEPNFVDPLLNRMEEKHVGMVCPKIYFYPGNEFHHDAYQDSERGKVIWYAGGVIDWGNVFASHWGVDEVDHGQYSKPLETDFATGCCVALTRNTIEKVGLMDEKYFLYYEDADWSMKIRHSGLKIIVEPKSIIYHKNAGSTGGSGSPLQQYYQTRNRIYFGMKFAPTKTKIHLIKNALQNLTSPNPYTRKGTLDALTYKLGPQPLTV